MKHLNPLHGFRRIILFDPITRFRLINAFLVSIGMSLLVPVIVILKGTLLPAWAISMFGIMNTLSVKTNEYFSKKPLSWLYKTGVVLHILFVLMALLYFVNPLWMVLLDSTLVIFEIAVFSAYGIVLNNHIADNHPEDMGDFQIVKNSTWADGSMIGLAISAFVTTYFGLIGMIAVFVTFNAVFSLWMIYNWNFYNRNKMIKKVTNYLEKEEKEKAAKQHRNDVYFMKHAELAATMSHCNRTKVGAVLVRDGRVVTEGRNGTLKGADNCCEDTDGKSKNTVMHAEANAITFAARHGIPTEGCSVYVTLSPCIECAKLMIQAGITEVVYDQEYRIDEGRDFLSKYVKVRQI